MVRVAFIHPDLGIGGAERLVVDAGLALKSRGHEVHFFTSHHDKSHCFEETRNGSLNVTSVGDWLPRHFFGCFYAFWAYLRMIYVAIYLIFFSSWRMDVIICDQVSVCIPVLKLSKARVVFYCHFPDMLLTQRKSFLKRLYRAPLDWLEEVTTGKVLEFIRGGQSSYPGAFPRECSPFKKKKIASNRCCGTFLELAKDMETKKILELFDVTQWFDFWYKHNQFYKGDLHQLQDSSLYV